MPAILPAARPGLSHERAADILAAHGIANGELALLGIRGYYLATMGNPVQNDRGIYDDAIFLVASDVFVAFNANADPSVFRKGIATLAPGLWRYRIGIHGLSKPVERQYTALVQAADVTVLRDGEGSETGRFGINIHRGGYRTTSSLGCQTIYPAQWESFITLVQAQLKRRNQSVINYLLVRDSRMA